MKRSRVIRLFQKRITHELLRDSKPSEFVRVLSDKHRSRTNSPISSIISFDLNSYKGLEIIGVAYNHSKDLDIDDNEFFENLYWEKEGYFEQNYYKNQGNEFAFQI